MTPATKSAPHITNTHTTMIDVAEVIVRECALRDPSVNRVTLGIIAKAKRNIQGKFRVKLTDINGGIRLNVRGNFFVQEIRIFTDKIQLVRTNLARFCRNRGFGISFGEPDQNVRP